MNNLEELKFKIEEIEHLIKCLVNLLLYYSENIDGNCEYLYTFSKILEEKIEKAIDDYDEIINTPSSPMGEVAAKQTEGAF